MIVTGRGPQENVITPPAATAATTAFDVQLAAVPVPTTRVGCEVSTARATAGTSAWPSGLPAAAGRGGRARLGCRTGLEEAGRERAGRDRAGPELCTGASTALTPADSPGAAAGGRAAVPHAARAIPDESASTSAPAQLMIRTRPHASAAASDIPAKCHETGTLWHESDPRTPMLVPRGRPSAPPTILVGKPCWIATAPGRGRSSAAACAGHRTVAEGRHGPAPLPPLEAVAPNRIAAAPIHDRATGVPQRPADSIKTDKVIDYPVLACTAAECHAITSIAAN